MAAALARASRRFGASLAAGALLIGAPIVAAPRAAVNLGPARLVSASPWLDRLNLWRASTGVGGLVENTTWSAGDYDHSQYMVMNDLVTHYETAGTPYYTTAGATAAQDGNIYVSSSTSTADTQAIDWWMGAPFHAMGLMDPRLTTTGFGSYRYVKSGWQMGAAIDVLRGNPFSGGTYPVFFPGSGTTEPLTTYSGNEWPDPLQACSGYAMPVGLPVSIQVGGNVATTVTAHSFTGNGVSLPSCVIDSTNATLGSFLTPRGGAILIPRSPLQNGVTYTVSMTVNGVPRTWSFTAGPFPVCNVTATATPPSPSAPGATIAVTGSATGCASPLYEFWAQAPNSYTWQLVQPYSPSPTYTWATAAAQQGGMYHFSVWARSSSSSGAFGNSLGRWDGYTSLAYTLSFNACSSVSVSAPATVAAGTSATLSATATGCTQPRYEFWLLPPRSSTWQLLQAYGSASTYVLTTSGRPTGSYRFSVWARDANSPGVGGDALGTWDSYTSPTVAVTSPCAGVVAAFSPSGTTTPGTPVTITATASACASPLYEFWVLAPGAQSWVLSAAYSPSATFTWMTTGHALGVYHFSIWARDVSSTGLAGDSLGRWDAYTALQYSLT